MTVTALARSVRHALADDIVEYTLTSAALTFSPSPSVQFAGLAYNGSIPGPLLRVTYGQRVRVRYRSAVDIPTSVHWHGMILPNEMDGAATITQAPVLRGGEFVYEFAPGPPGTRWYHDHAFHMGIIRGLFGVFIVDDPRDEPADKEFALVFHDVPQWNTLEAAQRGISSTAMTTLPGSPEAMEMMRSRRYAHSMRPVRPMHARHGMGDEVAYLAHCINGATYPRTPKLGVRVGDTVRLRVLNASPTHTRYVRFAGHRLTVTHSDGNRLAQPLEVDALRIGVAERYDAYFNVTRPGAFLLEGLTAEPFARQQAVLIYTEGMENAPPAESPQTLADVNYFTYEKAAGIALGDSIAPTESLRHEFALGVGEAIEQFRNGVSINGREIFSDNSFRCCRSRIDCHTEVSHPLCDF